MLTAKECRKELERLKTYIPILEKTGPIEVTHPDPSQPDVIMTAEKAKELIDILELVVKAKERMERL